MGETYDVHMPLGFLCTFGDCGRLFPTTSERSEHLVADHGVFPSLPGPPKLVRHLIFVPDDKATLVALSLTKEDVAAVLACLSVMGRDEREPERYREWYREVEKKIEAQVYAS